MNKAIITFLILLATSLVKGQTQLENSYFAAWQDIQSTSAPAGAYQEPVGNTWATSNEASMIFLAEPSVKKTSDSYIGEYAALIQTVQLGTTKGSGTLFTGKFKLDLAQPLNSTKFGIPFTDKPVYFKGFYKYFPVSGDSCRIASYLTKWNNTKYKRDTIAAASITRSESVATVSTYKEFDIIYHYYSTNSPDSITVIFASSADGANYNAAIGTKLYIDEISLGYFPLPVEKIHKSKDIAVYPNPASKYLVIESIPSEKKHYFKLYNSNGSFIMNKIIENSVEQISISDLSVGMYFYVINKADGSTETGKFLKK